MTTTLTTTASTSKLTAPAPAPTGRATQTSNQAAAAPADHEAIQCRAHRIFETRIGSGTGGDATSDWLQAERELNGTNAGIDAAVGAAKSPARTTPVVRDSKDRATGF